jgi:hypothetical protein
MKIFALVFSLFTLTAQAEIFICNTQELGSGFELEIETHFNQPVARYKVSQWSSAPPPAGGQKVILQGRGDLVVLQKIPRQGMRGAQEDYTKWIITSPDLSVNFTHYGVAHSFAKIAVAGGGLPGNFSLPKKNVSRNIRCLKKR